MEMKDRTAKYTKLYFIGEYNTKQNRAKRWDIKTDAISYTARKDQGKK